MAVEITRPALSAAEPRRAVANHGREEIVSDAGLGDPRAEPNRGAPELWNGSAGLRDRVYRCNVEVLAGPSFEPDAVLGTEQMSAASRIGRRYAPFLSVPLMLPRRSGGLTA